MNANLRYVELHVYLDWRKKFAIIKDSFPFIDQHYFLQNIRIVSYKNVLLKNLLWPQNLQRWSIAGLNALDFIEA